MPVGETSEPPTSTGPPSSPFCQPDVADQQEAEVRTGTSSQPSAAGTDASSSRRAEFEVSQDEGGIAGRPDCTEGQQASTKVGSSSQQSGGDSRDIGVHEERGDVVGDDYSKQQFSTVHHSLLMTPGGSERLPRQQVDARNSGRRTSATLKGGEPTGSSDPVYLRSYSFNQDNSCFVCATTAGFRVFTCAPLFEFARRELPAWGEGAYEVAGMLFRTNVFALVSQADSKKVKLWDDQKSRFIGELRSRQAVKNVCLGREILAMVTEYTVS